METSTATVREEDEKKPETDLNENELGNDNVKNLKKKKKKSKFNFIPKLGCMKLNDEFPAVEEKPDVDGSFDVEAGSSQKTCEPNHLIVMVNGIIGRLIYITDTNNNMIYNLMP